jgi:hypothetical protein
VLFFLPWTLGDSISLHSFNLSIFLSFVLIPTLILGHSHFSNLVFVSSFAFFTLFSFSRNTDPLCQFWLAMLLIGMLRGMCEYMWEKRDTQIDRQIERYESDGFFSSSQYGLVSINWILWIPEWLALPFTASISLSRRCFLCSTYLFFVTIEMKSRKSIHCFNVCW